MSSKFNWIAAVEALKELGEEVGTKKPKAGNVIDKSQPEAGFLKNEGNPVQGCP